MADDIVTQLRDFADSLPRPNGKSLLYVAAVEIERLRREATAFTVGPDEVLVVIMPDATSPEDIEWLRERFPSVVRDRVVFIGNLEARRG